MHKFMSVANTESLHNLLHSHSLTSLSRICDIPLSTLKRYKSGETDISSMPLRMVTALSKVLSNDHKAFEIPSHYAVSPEAFEYLVENIEGDTFNSIINLLEASLSFGTSEKGFFLVRDLYEIEGVDIELLLSIGANNGSKIIFPLTHSNYTKISESCSLTVVDDDIYMLSNTELELLKPKRQFAISKYNLRQFVLHEVYCMNQEILKSTLISIVRRLSTSDLQQLLHGNTECLKKVFENEDNEFVMVLESLIQNFFSELSNKVGTLNE